MIELLGMVFGGVSRLVPELLKMWSAKGERAHELEMTRLQLDIDKARATQQLDMVHAQGAIADGSAELKAWGDAILAQAAKTGVAWADALSASVRPVLTYWWCVGLYSVYKAVTIAVAIHQDAQLATLAPLLVTEFDKTLIGSIVSFWFVDRSLRKS